MIPSELAALRAEYDRETAEYLATIHPACRPLHRLTLPCFHDWAAEQGHALPDYDLTDPYIARRLSQYLDYREHAFARFGAVTRETLESEFIDFDTWLASFEAHISDFGETLSNDIFVAPHGANLGKNEYQ